jgi:hypothetical protein
MILAFLLGSKLTFLIEFVKNGLISLLCTIKRDPPQIMTVVVSRQIAHIPYKNCVGNL